MLGDPNVVFSGPGIHEVSHMVVTNNQTVYVAGGAIVQAIIGSEEPFIRNRSCDVSSKPSRPSEQRACLPKPCAPCFCCSTARVCA